MSSPTRRGGRQKARRPPNPNANGFLCACCYVNDAAIHHLALLTFNQLATKRAPVPRARTQRVPEVDGLRECSGVGSSTDLSIGALGKRARDDDADDVSAAAKRPRHLSGEAQLDRAPPSASACAAVSPPSAAAAASRETPTAGTHAVVTAGPVSTPGDSASRRHGATSTTATYGAAASGRPVAAPPPAAAAANTLKRARGDGDLEDGERAASQRTRHDTTTQVVPASAENACADAAPPTAVAANTLGRASGNGDLGDGERAASKRAPHHTTAVASDTTTTPPAAAAAGLPERARSDDLEEEDGAAAAPLLARRDLGVVATAIAPPPSRRLSRLGALCCRLRLASPRLARPSPASPTPTSLPTAAVGGDEASAAHSLPRLRSAVHRAAPPTAPIEPRLSSSNSSSSAEPPPAVTAPAAGPRAAGPPAAHPLPDEVRR